MSKGHDPGYREEDRGYGSPCWIWLGGSTPLGYGRRSVPCPERGRRLRPAHRSYYEERFGPVDDGLHIDHLCRVPACVNPSHLEPVIPAENHRRAVTTRLVHWQVVEIKRALAIAAEGRQRVPKGTFARLAEQYGVTPGIVRHIRKGDSWRDVV